MHSSSLFVIVFWVLFVKSTASFSATSTERDPCEANDTKRPLLPADKADPSLKSMTAEDCDRYYLSTESRDLTKAFKCAVHHKRFDLLAGEPFEVNRALKPLMAGKGVRMERRPDADGKDILWAVGSMNLGKILGCAVDSDGIQTDGINVEVSLEIRLG